MPIYRKKMLCGKKFFLRKTGLPRSVRNLKKPKEKGRRKNDELSRCRSAAGRRIVRRGRKPSRASSCARVPDRHRGRVCGAGSALARSVKKQCAPKRGAACVRSGQDEIAPPAQDERRRAHTQTPAQDERRRADTRTPAQDERTCASSQTPAQDGEIRTADEAAKAEGERER